MAQDRQMKLAAYLIGTGMHVASWRHPTSNPNASIDVKALQRLSKIAEKGKFDLAFVADSLAINHESHPQILNRFDPIVLITALAAATEKIGIGATASTTYSEPYVLARQFASVDHISGGRVGWNVVTTADATGETALNFSRDKHLAHDHRYERAEEFIDVVQGLWDSWEDDAFVHNKETGQFFDPDKVHELRYKGNYFSVKGPLNIARSAQGQPVIIQAGASIPGQRLAARTAEVVFTHWDNIEESKRYYQELKSSLMAFGRSVEELHILHGISPIIGETEEIAIQKYNKLQSLVDPYESLKFVSGYMGNVDFSKYSLDTPAKDVEFPLVNSIQSNFNEMKKIIGEEDIKVGELYARFFSPARRDRFVGTPTQVADEMEVWFTEKAADGFMLQFPLLPGDLEDFVEKVVPILQERGLFRLDYEGDTLRDHLGLKNPKNRFANEEISNYLE
ncbi:MULTISPECIES: LLM class flavin-dependent oxidoreductase [Peribacillus]|jgi:FMN-dependent oxidoreductase (nitrilotriacetate monooxygenase family)|uniref:LLM class flavin-dependent oxidoreductase n=1 Tax=Peribacillus TaxID=2675229 RepID=UPI00203CF7D4|nr:LLM class flavin-dependent oxidoreductase [Peribacillus frigoritolerans]MCD1162083.1 LLM class flavin-dependent oxidoreductase [Peribacillus castrilensis]MCP1094102.1 LLM class flavin-dependent oxidoreductase [Bacillaceae bacterium OS4b]QYF82501.1 LLM class flavin-dependent oxidoreductase [Brevibacterium sp. PAMC21349]MCM3168094.1 LLM class flavin-dependent oxidoreductase [Peribacillus frigoritolerans]MCU6600694.1 LLM class flavin-dependent oxidoreductase [Peribacillus frigoritolerans]